MKKQTTKAVFLDRDGVINEDFGYVYKSSDFKFRPMVFEALKRYQDLGFKLFIVTNQSGIGRGYYTKKEFLTLNEYMLEQFYQNGISIQKVYFCPHDPDSGCECRKPKPKMILDAKKEFNLDLKSSILVGDKLSDIEAGINARIKKTLFDKH